MKTLVEFAGDQLRERILAGALPPGEWIRLDAIADELGMSPIPLREALRTLVSEGLVVPLPRRGFRVAPATVEDLEETYRLRLVLEPLAVQLATPHLTPLDLKALAGRLDRLASAFNEGDWQEQRTNHRAFHFGIYESCRSAWLIRFIDMLWLNTERYQRMTMQIKGELRQRNREHRQILAACRAGQAGAAGALMHDHLSRALDSLRAFLEENTHLVDAATAADVTGTKREHRATRS